MNKLPKFIIRLLNERVSLVIQVCHDLDLQRRSVYYPYDSQEYQASLYDYSCRVRDELNKISNIDEEAK